ncbi:unnamed protein product, partial [Adineta steineri]
AMRKAPAPPPPTS